MATRGVSRREFGTLGAPTLLAILVYLRSHPAEAQESSSNIYELLKIDRARLGELTAELRSAERLHDPKFMSGVEQYDLDQRRKEATALWNYASQTGSVEAFVKTAAEGDLIVPEALDITAAMLQHQMSPIPDPSQITGVPGPPIPKLRPERKLDVVMDIILEATGLLEIKEICTEVMREIPGFDDQIDAAEKAAQAQNSQKLVDAVFNVADFIFQWAAAKLFLEKLAAKGVAAIFLRQLALRMVPFVGWGWMLVAVGIAVHRNWDRLMA